MVADFRSDVPAVPETSLYVMEMCSNDLLAARKALATGVSRREIGDRLKRGASSVVEQIGVLLDHAPRPVLLLNCPDLGTTPYARQTEFGEQMTAFATEFNQELARLVPPLRQRTQLIELDLFSTLRQARDNPASLGLPAGLDTRGTCEDREARRRCHDPAAYFYFDDNHPTEGVHRALARLAWQRLQAGLGGR
jgi:phospholipase/lecithinase/hemolysin